MLYEVGMYINPVGLHRHAYYVISRSELYGFTPMQRKIIATVARFQGNSKPQLRDRLIKLLPAPDQVRRNKDYGHSARSPRTESGASFYGGINSRNRSWWGFNAGGKGRPRRR